MSSQSLTPEAHPRRHDLVVVSAASWRALVRGREDLAGMPLLVGWADRGWPLVACRRDPRDGHGIALGLPMPPLAGKRRVRIVVQREDVVAMSPPLALHAAIGGAPSGWQPTLLRVSAMAMRHGIEARVFGSLAWQTLTGLAYLSEGSDLDLLFPLGRSTDPLLLARELQAIERAAPMRIDGEVIRADGAGVNWREIDMGSAGVLVKTITRVKLRSMEDFLAEGVAT